MGAYGTWDADETTNEMIRRGQMQEIIIVAADHGPDRSGEYTPPGDEALGSPGRGDQYAAFLIDELKTVIDATYRTRPRRDDTAAMGASLGGNISLYLGWDYGATFGKIGCMSSAFWTVPNFLTRVIEDPKPTLRIYMDSGDSGSGYDGAEATMYIRDVLLAKGFVQFRDLFHTVGYGHIHHEDAWAARLPGALAYLFPPDESDNPLREEIFRGDLDHDGDMDIDDYVLLESCLAGPGAPLPDPCTPDADLDGDGDTDLADAAVFAVHFTGSL
jgi:predicted alpha/beta superfamily hydrolase